MKPIAIGCDEAAFDFRNNIREFLLDKGYEVEDYGVYDKNPALYPDIAITVAQAVAEGKHEKGILICGTGIGMCICANKVKGIRAAVCHDMLSAQRARKSNDAQILCIGARIIAPQLGQLLVEEWLKSEFEGGNSIPKVEKIKEYESLLFQ